MDERRRSTRVTGILPILVTGVDVEGQRFREMAWTVSLNNHGAKASTVKKLAKGDPLTILFGPNQEAVGSRVVWTSQMGQGYVIGIELAQPRNVWGFDNPPADWGDGAARTAGTPENGASQQGRLAAAPQDLVLEKDSSANSPNPLERADASVVDVNLPTDVTNRRAELGRLFEKIQQALTVTSESLKVYEDLESESARLVSDARDRIQIKVAAELERMIAQAVEAVSAHARSLLDKTGESLSSMQQEHEASAERNVCKFEERLEAAAQANLEKSGRRMEELAHAAVESAASQTQAIMQTVRETAEAAKKEFDDHLSQALENCRQEIQKEAAAALGHCREGATSVLGDVHKRLLTAAGAINSREPTG